MRENGPIGRHLEARRINVFLMDAIWGVQEVWRRRLPSIEMSVFQESLIGRGLQEHLSGPLWPDPNHNSKRATLYGSSVPYTRQSTNQEDSLVISGLTTNGEIYNNKTYFIPLGGERSL